MKLIESLQSREDNDLTDNERLILELYRMDWESMTESQQKVYMNWSARELGSKGFLTEEQANKIYENMLVFVEEICKE